MRLISLAAAAALGFICCGRAEAQYDPGASADLGAGLGSTALGQSILGGTRNLDTGGGDSDELSPTMKDYCAKWPDEGVCKADRARKARRAAPVPADLDAKMREVAPEYNRRLHLYGKEKADRWLAETARAMGERDGAAARE